MPGSRVLGLSCRLGCTNSVPLPSLEKIFQIPWRHKLAICLLLPGYQMQHLTLVMPGGRDRRGGGHCGSRWCSLLSSHRCLYLYAGETRDEVQHFVWAFMCVICFSSSVTLLSWSMYSWGESWCFSMYGEGCVAHFHNSCAHFIPGPSQRIHVRLFNNPFTLWLSQGPFRRNLCLPLQSCFW